MKRLNQKEIYEDFYVDGVMIPPEKPTAIMFYKRHDKVSRELESMCDLHYKNVNLRKVDMEFNQDICNDLQLSESSTILYINELGKVDLTIGYINSITLNAYMAELIKEIL